MGGELSALASMFPTLGLCASSTAAGRIEVSMLIAEYWWPAGNHSILLQHPVEVIDGCIVVILHCFCPFISLHVSQILCRSGGSLLIVAPCAKGFSRLVR
jgi:hypothetical protein